MIQPWAEPERRVALRNIQADLLYHEVANALRYKPEHNQKKLYEAVDELLGLQLNTWPVDSSLLSRASAIAYTREVTIFDAVPVALAQLRGTICLTAGEHTRTRG